MKSGACILFFLLVLLSSCGNKINDGQYLMKNYRFVDSALERQLTDAVVAMDVPDSVMLVLAQYDYDWTSQIRSVGIGTFHPEYHYGSDIRSCMMRMDGVTEIAGRKCLVDMYGLPMEETTGSTLVTIRDSLDDDIEMIQMEDNHFFFLDTTGRVVGDSPIYDKLEFFFDNAFNVVENDPEFPGGQDSLQAFMERHLRNPRQVEGKVYVQFIVERNGRMTNLKVLRGIDEETDEEALRVMRLMPRWIPGRQRDKLARVWVYYPVKISPTEQ